MTAEVSDWCHNLFHSPNTLPEISFIDGFLYFFLPAFYVSLCCGHHNLSCEFLFLFFLVPRRFSGGPANYCPLVIFTVMLTSLLSFLIQKFIPWLLSLSWIWLQFLCFRGAGTELKSPERSSPLIVPRRFPQSALRAFTAFASGKFNLYYIYSITVIMR